MTHPVYITDFSIKVPGISDPDELNEAIFNDKFQPQYKSILTDTSEPVQFGILDFDKNSPFYPNSADLKIMRQDVLAATICIGELMHRLQLSQNEVSKTPLFVASGVFVESLFNQNERMSKSFINAVQNIDPVERRVKISQLVPPLIALNLLTNATESYVAQYSGLAGNNTTYGNTSHAGYYALQKACKEIQNGNEKRVVVGASNSCGSYSYITFKNKTRYCSNWKESPGAIFILLESELGMRESMKKPICRIQEIKSSLRIPELGACLNKKPFDYFSNCVKSELAVYSGAYSNFDFQNEFDQVSAMWKDSFSWYRKLGNLGALSVLMNIITAVKFIEKNKFKQVDCINRDPFERESEVKICA